MGVIYLARQEGAAGFARPVVVKRLMPDLSHDDDMIKMFVREAHILGSLHHPGIVDVVEFAEEDGAYVMVLEYVQGHDLGQWRRYLRKKNRPVPVDVALHVVIQVLEALHHAHTLRHTDGSPATVIHRDVTPSNILLHVDGHVKLADFGIARMKNLSTQYRTQSPSLKGKLAYLAPELFQSAPPSPQTDVYACGVVLHEVLTGVNEFRVGEMPQAVHRILHHQPTPVSELRDDIPAGLDAVLARAMAKSPSDRYPDAESMAADLRGLRGQPEEAIAAELARSLRVDFFGELPQALGVTPIGVLDEAWREPSTEPHLPSPDATRTVPGRPGALPSADGAPPPHGAALQDISIRVEEVRPRRWRRPLPWVGAAAAVGLLALGVTTWGSGDAPPAEDAEPKFILLDRTGPDEAGQPDPEPAAEGDRAADTAAEATARPPTTEEPAPQHTAAARTRSHRPRRKVDPAANLGAAFARQRGRIEACFTRHVPDGETDPRLLVRFRIAASGKVESAELVPPDRTTTPLGRCVLQVARGTRFPSQPEPITFRIPIHVSTR
jgi:eukaryotic-like serine/threonine-protein kinase